jgi:glycosyltransferase involved in cell wall biosynthesis
MNAKENEKALESLGRAHRSIMFLVNSLRVGGSERKTVRLANALAASDRRVVIAYLGPPETLLSQVHPAVSAVNLQRRGKFSIRALRRLAAMVREHYVGTLVAVNLYSGLYAVLVKLLCRNRHLRTAVSVNTTAFASRKEELQMLIYRHVLWRADAIAFGAESQRDLWRSRYRLRSSPDKTMVLYNGVDTREFSRERVTAAPFAAPAGRVMLGTVGAFRIEKAQVDLVRAVHELARRGLDVGALIVGDGPERPQLEREILRLSVEHRVQLVGEVQDVRPYLAIMDIFVLTSVAVETFSNAALEAMAMSCPVLVAQVGGMAEMLRFGGGMTYPPGDVQSLCDVLMPLAVSAGARQALGEQARDAVRKHFSLERMLSEFRERVVDGP